MLRAAAVCPTPGCPQPQPCPTHKRIAWEGQQSATERGYGASWQKTRARILHRDRRRCYQCGQPANEVDHITPKADGGDDTDTNLAAICSPCHRRKTLDEAQRARRARVGYHRGPTPPD